MTNPTHIQISINNFSQILGLHQRTLRIWDKEGILVPSRTEGNRRYYTMDDIKKGEFILFLTRNLLLNLTGVKIILGLLKRYETEEDRYINYINEIAKGMDINEEKQKENLKKNAKRGSKRKD